VREFRREPSCAALYSVFFRQGGDFLDLPSDGEALGQSVRWQMAIRSEKTQLERGETLAYRYHHWKRPYRKNQLASATSYYRYTSRQIRWLGKGWETRVLGLTPRAVCLLAASMQCCTVFLQHAGSFGEVGDIARRVVVNLSVLDLNSGFAAGYDLVIPMPCHGYILCCLVF
jgi:hypothetical protein